MRAVMYMLQMAQKDPLVMLLHGRSSHNPSPHGRFIIAAETKCVHVHVSLSLRRRAQASVHACVSVCEGRSQLRRIHC